MCVCVYVCVCVCVLSVCVCMSVCVYVCVCVHSVCVYVRAGYQRPQCTRMYRLFPAAFNCGVTESADNAGVRWGDTLRLKQTLDSNPDSNKYLL